MEIVQRQLKSRTVKAGEEELFKSKAREQERVKIIDLITARLDAKTDSYVAILPSLRLTDARISADLVRRHDRMLTGGFYAEITLEYDAAIAQENKGHPSVLLLCGKYSSPSGMCWIFWPKRVKSFPLKNGRISYCAASALNLRLYQKAERRSFSTYSALCRA